MWIAYFYESGEKFVSGVRNVGNGFFDFSYSSEEKYAVPLNDVQFRAFCKWRKDCYEGCGFGYSA